MDNARQIIRWAIPGWTFFIFFLMFILVRQIVNNFGVNSAGFRLSHMFKEFSGFLDPTVGLLLGAAGIPIGYLIYQIYFNRAWSVTRLFKGNFLYMEDRGKEVLEGVPLDKIFGRSYSNFPPGLPREVSLTPDFVYWPPQGSRRSRILPTVRYLPAASLRDKNKVIWTEKSLEEAVRSNWSLTLFIWYRFVVPEYEDVNRQVTYMFDISHSQGAVVWSLMFAYGLYNLYDSLANVQSLQHLTLDIIARTLAIVVIDFSLFVLLYKAIVSVRRNVIYQIVFLMRNVISYQCTSADSPTPYPNATIKTLM